MESSNPPTRAPWKRLPGETAKAYAAFLHYLSLPPNGRSIAAAVEAAGRKQSTIRHWERWSSQYGWVDRAQAYDVDALTRSMEHRQQDTERARQRLYDQGLDLLNDYLAMGQGRMPVGDATPVTDKHGKIVTHRVIGQDGEERDEPIVRPLVPASVRARVFERALCLIGLNPPKRMELSGRDGDAIRLQAHAALAQLAPDKLEALASTFGVIDGEGNGDD